MNVSFSLYAMQMITNVKLYEDENGKYPCSSNHINCKPYQIDISPGRYLFELWGTQGGNSNCPSSCHDKRQYGGYGGYSQSVYKIKVKTRLYLYIGAQPLENQFGTPAKGGYNGGGDSGDFGGGGGGATDIRLRGGEWNQNFDKRLIVAGGGGGNIIYIESSHRGGNGGGIVGSEEIGNEESCFSVYATIFINLAYVNHDFPIINETLTREIKKKKNLHFSIIFTSNDFLEKHNG